MQLIKISNVKQFMNKLLIENSFDSFLVSEVIIKTFGSFVIDGHINEGFYSDDEISEFEKNAENENRIFSKKMCRWSTLKPTTLSLLKGKKTPLFFKISFYLADENINKLLTGADTSITANDIEGLSLIAKYQDSELVITSSTTLKIFSLDKSLDKIWDEMVMKFLDSQSIECEVM